MNTTLLGLAVGLLVPPLLLLLYKPQSSDLNIILPSSPQRLSTTDIVFLYIKALLKLVPGYSPSLKPNVERTGFDLPRISVEGRLQVKSEDLRNFRGAVPPRNYEERDGNVMFLVALTLPLLVGIFTMRGCPIKPLGAVNTSNIFKFLDPHLCRDFGASRNAKNITYQATFGGPDNPGKRKKRGVEFCVKIIIFSSGKAVVEQELWFLQFLPASAEPKWNGIVDEPKNRSDIFGEGVGQKLRMTTADPTKWAACCGDYNPIHVSSIGAKLFGFPGVIAHGNHVLALVVEQLRSLTSTLAGVNDSFDNAKRLCWEEDVPLCIEVDFKRPFVLPGEAEIKWEKGMFGVVKSGKVILEGWIYPVEHETKESGRS